MLNPSPNELCACLAVKRWVDEVAAAAPYDSLDELVSVARAAATSLSSDEIAEALAEHPRIAENPKGEGRAQSFSREEQSSVDAEDVELAAAIDAGNASYEQRFGRVFLIRAKGRSRAEILAELNRRLELDHETEQNIIGSELRDIALLRLTALYSGENR